MIAAIHQPQYVPWLGYIDKIDRADAFCFLDNVQYKKNDWQNRNRIKTTTGWQWLTLPVRFRFPQRINEVKINNAVNWRRKHLQALITNYHKSAYFEPAIELFRQVYAADWQCLADVNIEIISRLMTRLGIKNKKTARASTLTCSDDPNGRLIEICRALGCDTYLAGADGANYMDLARFERSGIKVVFQEFTHPVYPQLYGDFVSHLSAVDLLFNCGPEGLKILREANSR